MKFYVLVTMPDESQSSAIVDALPSDIERLGDAPQCLVCHRYIGGRVDLPPYEVELELIGKEFGDIVDFSAASVLVSSKFVQRWLKSKLIGLSGFYDVSIKRVKKSRKIDIPPPSYYLAIIVRSRAAIDAKKSVLIREDGEICPECRQGGLLKRVARIVLEEGTWQGEDIFIARGLTGRIIVSERFREFCEKYEIKNAVLIEAEKYGFDFYSSEN